MKLALFGGTFDPVHLGHIAVAVAARQEEGLDRVLFVPARQSPFKPGVTGATGRQRCAMIELAIRDLPWASLWDGELERPAPSYSWQTVAFFRNALPGTELFWILGADQWSSISSWTRSDYLAQAVTFLVFARGQTGAAPRSGFRMKALPAVHPASSTSIRRGSTEQLDARVARYVRAQGLYADERLESAIPSRPAHSASTERPGRDLFP